MRVQFANHQAVTIDSVAPNVIVSTIDIVDVAGKIIDVNVAVDVDHSFTADLVMTLIGPEGTQVRLVAHEGFGGDNFRSTIFDDQAGLDVRDANPPFTGTFRPEQSLDAFNQHDPNGTWTLEIRDDAFEDGGELKSWELDIELEAEDEESEIDTLVFHSANPVQIRADRPDTVISAIHVTGHLDQLVQAARVTVDIEHGFTQDLTLTLISPPGERVLLADRVGGGEDHFHLTVFSDDAETTIRKGEAPFTGTFRPQEPLASQIGKPINGAWRLEVQDHESGDGGALKSWSIELDTLNRVVPESQFHIDVEFLGGLTSTQRAVFQDAAARWSEIIVGDLPEDEVDGTPVDDVVIGAQGKEIDGAGGPGGNILGQAGPTHLRDESRLPIAGVMTFDTHDLDAMEADGSLLDVIVHEMGHVLGIGTLWNHHGLLQNPADGIGVDDPVFVGAGAVAEYGALRGSADGQPVPVADQGGPGTRNGHWRERVFDTELMTGWIDQGTVNPISRITVASLADLGYEVNLNAADDYGMPAMMAARRGPGLRRGCCTLHAQPDDRSLREALVTRPNVANIANVGIQEVKVGEKLSWNVKLGSAGGVTLGDAGEAEVEAVLTAPAQLPKQMANPLDLDLQLADVDKLNVLLVSSTVYDGKVEVKGDGAVVTLTGPLLLFGDSIKQFSGSLDTLTVQNKSDNDAQLQILIGRKLTA